MTRSDIYREAFRLEDRVKELEHDLAAARADLCEAHERIKQQDERDIRVSLERDAARAEVARLRERWDRLREWAQAVSHTLAASVWENPIHFLGSRRHPTMASLAAEVACAFLAFVAITALGVCAVVGLVFWLLG